MTSEKFRRAELAYAMSRAAASSALVEFPRIANGMNMTLSGPAPVETLYFDDIRHSLYRQGRDKNPDQMQVRVRSYADSSPTRKYIELKITKGKDVDKRRTIVHVEAWGDSAGFCISALPETDAPTLSRFQEIIDKRELIPTLLMRYERTALSSSNNDSFRLTADEGICAKSVVGVRWDSKDLLLMELVVFELKTTGPLSIGLARELERLRLGEPQPVSKFVKCTEALFDVGS